MEIYNYKEVMFIISKFLLQFKFDHIKALTLSNMPAGLYFVLKYFTSILPQTEFI
jgi:hypothetical protein